tara:strand:+ start:475 stop:744 length:270 start_codon:yes stop_codon:yes gene_type:complete
MQEENETLREIVSPDSEVKKWLVEYVGEKTQPEDNQVTVEMVVETVADEFPDFLAAVAEENWVRGYQQAINDIAETEKEINQHMTESNE